MTWRESVAGAAAVARAVADEVDADARFPHEAVRSLRTSGLLAAFVPSQQGGLGLSVREVHEATATLGSACTATAMVFAMHQVQVACLVRHGGKRGRALAARVAADGLLVASATTEAGTGGDNRRSTCALLPAEDGSSSVEKSAPVISYGEHADAILVTARREKTSPAADQVLVWAQRPGLRLEATGGWDVLGLRGTVSKPFRLCASVRPDDVLPDAYGDINARTMAPLSHLLWSGLWCGIATEAASRARAAVRAQRRRSGGGELAGATRLAELAAVLQQLRDLSAGGLARWEGEQEPEPTDPTFASAVAVNVLKTQGTVLLVDLVSRALAIIGMQGYATRGPLSVARLLRDAYGTEVMISNDRLTAQNAQLVLAVGLG